MEMVGVMEPVFTAEPVWAKLGELDGDTEALPESLVSTETVSDEVTLRVDEAVEVGHTEEEAQAVKEPEPVAR